LAISGRGGKGSGKKVEGSFSHVGNRKIAVNREPKGYFDNERPLQENGQSWTKRAFISCSNTEREEKEILRLRGKGGWEPHKKSTPKSRPRE